MSPLSITLLLAALATAPASDGAAERAYIKAQHTRTAAWVLLGVGAAALVAGGTSYGVATARSPQLQKDVINFNEAYSSGAPTASPAARASLAARSRELSNLRTSGAIVGLFGVATSAACLVTFLVGDNPETLRPSNEAVSWNFSVTPGHAQLGMRF